MCRLDIHTNQVSPAVCLKAVLVNAVTLSQARLAYSGQEGNEHAERGGNHFGLLGDVLANRMLHAGPIMRRS